MRNVLSKKMDKPVPRKFNESLIKLFQLIEAHYKKERNADFYSNRLSLTLKRVNEITKKQLGKTVTRLLHDRLLLEAKREINFGKRSHKEIAYLLGFDDPAYFSRFFKKRTGITPEQFKIKTFK